MEIFKYGHQELEHLKKRDKKLGAAIEKIGMIEREIIPDLFSALVNSIVGQQISSKAAITVWNRLQEQLGIISPETIESTTIENIQQCGLSMRKAGYIKGIAEAVVSGQLNLAQIYSLSDDEIIEQLLSLKGIGKWTAEMILIFSMERPNVVSWGDFAIQRGMMRLYGLKSLSKEQFDKYVKRYSPYGSVASLYLWELSKE
jgi:3-methyladenine DNA glycosylase/8-oxoguanine DNA glycosylase